MKTQSLAIANAIALLVVVAVLVSLAFGVYGFTRTPTVGSSSLTTSQSTNSCSDVPPPASETYSYTFTIGVNYSGPWRVNYKGYATGGLCNLETSGTESGTGIDGMPVVLTGPVNNGLTLCATATKLDGSNNSLTLNIIPSSNSTSVPYGSTTDCGGVFP